MYIYIHGYICDMYFIYIYILYSNYYVTLLNIKQKVAGYPRLATLQYIYVM